MLEQILAQKRLEIKALYGKTLPVFPAMVSRKNAQQELVKLRRRGNSPLRLFFEIKRKSPSAGMLSSQISILERSRLYETYGASGISVLTDSTFFGGSYYDLHDVASQRNIPILCKEFVIDPIQLKLAWQAGATWVLLIVRILTEPKLRSLIGMARSLGLEPLVEVTNEEESQQALAAGAAFLGVNARDLDTLQIDHQRALRVLGNMPEHVVAFHLSGIHSVEQLEHVEQTRADGVLIGEALMRLPDPTQKLEQFQSFLYKQRW
jgi:indole-3-glycerol phosphate synthase